MRFHHLALTAALAASTAPAGAVTIAFSGTRANINPISPPGSGRCAPTYFNTVSIAPGSISSTGTSNLGSFASTQSHCIVTAPPTTVVDGLFTYDFGNGDTFFGTYTGNVSLSGTPGTFDTVENLILTGGTGRFAGATGTVTSGGQLYFAANPTGAPGVAGFFTGQVTGTLDIPGVPEPITWATMVTGFGLAGAALRRRRRAPAMA